MKKEKHIKSIGLFLFAIIILIWASCTTYKVEIIEPETSIETSIDNIPIWIVGSWEAENITINQDNDPLTISATETEMTISDIEVYLGEEGRSYILSDSLPSDNEYVVTLKIDDKIAVEHKIVFITGNDTQLEITTTDLEAGLVLTNDILIKKND